MNLVDTSAWIDFLRGHDTAATRGVRDLLGSEPVGTTEPVVMELLAGAVDERAFARTQAWTSSLHQLRIQPDLDFSAAATIFRSARQQGQTVRRLVDCLIAAVAMRHEAVLVHKDADFDAIAAVTPLRVRSLR